MRRRENGLECIYEIDIEGSGICSAAGSREVEKLRHQKVQRRITRDTGKVFHPERNRHVTTPEMAKKAAEGLVQGLGPTVALREAGFPEFTCQRGKKGINRMIRAEFGKLGRKYITMGRELSPEDQENIVRGRLLENVIIGTDRGVLSAKQLGSDKRISMWRADSQVGMVILSPPPIPKIDHEVPLIEVPWIETKAQKRHNKEEEVEDDSR